jgi:hypothetical protein
MMKAEVGRIVVVVHEPELRVFGPFESRDKALVWLTQHEARTKRGENNYNTVSGSSRDSV